MSEQTNILVKQNNDLTKQINHFAKENNDLTLQITHFVRENNDLTKQIRSEISNQLRLQIELQNEITAVNSVAFSEYKNIFSNRDIVILGAGPTLNKYIPIKDAIHIGVNSVCTYEKIELDYYFIQDFDRQMPGNVLYEKEILNLKCKKFFGLLACTPNGLMEPSESFCTQANATRYFVDHSPSNYIYPDIRFHPLMDFCSVVFPALHFALFTNPKCIYLVGCDTSYNGYFTGGKQKDSIEEKRHYLFLMLMGYYRLKEFAKIWYPATEIISVNPVNLKSLFRDMYTDEKGTLTEDVSSEKYIDFSDVAKVKNFVDRHIEQVLLDRFNNKLFCKECEGNGFSVVRGLSDNVPDSIEVKCNTCGSNFLIC